MAVGDVRERWSRRRLSIALLVLGGVGAAAVGLPWALDARGGGAAVAGGGAAGPNARARRAMPTPQPGQKVRWNGARLDPGASGEPERLTLYFVGAPPGPLGPCSPAYEATAEPGADRITVTVRALPTPDLPAGHYCTSVGADRDVAISLPEPLQGRKVVDGSNGEARPVFDARALLTPTYLPAGYRPSREGVMYGLSSYTRTWLADGPPGAVQLTVTAGGGEMLRPGYHEVVLARPTVRGAAAKVTKTRDFDDNVCVTWREGSAGHSVCTSGDPKRLLPIAELVRVAQGLR
jgi:hypothetical protein